VPTATNTPEPFRITGVTYPSSVVSGGAKGSLSVSWSGQPKFPVTMLYEMYSCPPNTTCSNPAMTFPTPANPLVFPEAVWCYGFTETVQFGYRVILTDANGKTTNAWDAPFTCTP